ncbi:MAG TPA: divalent-cation tolerance protein CutA [archaeon]|nr:divalent-cation tolerance protein CutA [archaeon]
MQLVYITVKNLAEGKKIAKVLLEKKLVSCANIVPKIHSLYWWNKKIESASESLLLLKAPEKNFNEIEKEAKKLHSYSCPAIVSIEINKSSRDYLKWLYDSLK